MLTLIVNGTRRNVDAAEDTALLWVLRDHLGLTGTKYGCGIAMCGACTVHVDGVARRSCVTPVSTVVGKSIKDLGISEGVRFGAIVRDGQVFAPTGSTELEPKDRAILFARADHVRQVEQLFRVSPDYF